ncbi:hypothetical protein QMO56_25495 [Roseomonas sp. E05]|uniref:WD40/YVTN/BNR-like repeat-containing protein n=1 Tax=Roseomonas sp. E05 TaxID=3046310 RepID=UPI0024BAD8A7|nr:hypothetical protein [Roseomonas sp. E05]MDJ0391463.1 hypothetical protein [Roseomonas sp. E05]
MLRAAAAPWPAVARALAGVLRDGRGTLAGRPPPRLLPRLAAALAALLPLAGPGAGARVALAQAAGQEAYQWRHVAIGGGGFITGYDADPAGRTRVVRADVYGAYLWREDLDRWVQLANSASMPEADRRQNGVAEGVYEIAVAPSRPSRIYMAVKGLVYRSDDRGASFASPVREAPFPFDWDANSEFRHAGPFLAVSPLDPDLVLLGTPSDGVWRSADGARSWSRVASVPAGSRPEGVPVHRTAGTSLWFQPAAAGPGEVGARVWALVPGAGVFASANGGVDFSPLDAVDGEQPRRFNQGSFAPDGAFYAADPWESRLWRYRGGSWTDLTPQIGPHRFIAVAVNPRDGQVFVFDENGRAWRSADGGRSWWALWHGTRPGDGDPPWLRVSNAAFILGRVTFDPVVPDRLWAASGTGVYYADLVPSPLQLRWISQTRGIEELVANDVISPPGGAPLFAAWDFGVHRKEDLDRFSTSYGPRERLLIAAQQLDWSPADPLFIVTNASDTRTFCCAEDGNAVLAGYSTDGGRSWRKFPALPQPPGTDAADPWRMSFGTIAVAADDTRNIVWAPSFNRSPFVTRDRGRTWSRVSLAGEVLPLTGSHAHYFYTRKTLAADRVLPGVFYLVHSGEGENAGLAGLWATEDGGARWQRRFAGEIAPDSRYSAKLRAVPGQAGHLFFTSGYDGGSDTQLRRSTDGGASWRVLETVDRVDDIGFGRAADGAAYPAIFISGRVGGRYGIWRSTDNAARWTRIGGFPAGTLDQVSVVAGDPDRFGRVYLGYKGSGWIYGQPGGCTPAPYDISSTQECHAADN